MSRWWLAAVLTLLSPWISPHVDYYLPLGYIAWHALRDGADALFWALAGAFLLVIYLCWVALLTVVTWWLAKRRARSQ